MSISTHGNTDSRHHDSGWVLVMRQSGDTDRWQGQDRQRDTKREFGHSEAVAYLRSPSAVEAALNRLTARQDGDGFPEYPIVDGEATGRRG